MFIYISFCGDFLRDYILGVVIPGYFINIGNIFPGVWKLHFFDPYTKAIYFLKSHNEFKISCFALPLLLKSFYDFNSKKLFLTLFKKSRLFYSGIYRILYVKQLGLCYICHQPLNNLYIKIKLFRLFSSTIFCIRYFFLVHTYCCLF